MERLNEEVGATEECAEQRLWDEIRRNSPVGLAAEGSVAGLHSAGLAGAMKYHLGAEQSSRLLEFHTSAREGGAIEIAYGNWNCALVSADRVPETKKFVAKLMEAVGQWSEREDLQRILADRRRVIEIIRDELATITLRRVLPGRCKYCPI